MSKLSALSGWNINVCFRCVWPRFDDIGALYETLRLQWYGHLRSNCFFFILASSGCALAPRSHSGNQCVAHGTGPWPMAGPLTKSAWPSCHLLCRRTLPTSNSQQTGRRSTWSQPNVVSTWTPNTPGKGFKASQAVSCSSSTSKQVAAILAASAVQPCT